MDKRGANKAAIDAVNAGRDVPIPVRQSKYRNNIVEQDHRAIKRVTRPMLNFKSFHSAASEPSLDAGGKCNGRVPLTIRSRNSFNDGVCTALDPAPPEGGRYE